MISLMEPKAQNTHSQDFDTYLLEYQPDLKRIIGKYRYSHHMLDADEMLSEVNLSIVKKKDAIIEMLGENFCQTEFTKVAYNYAKNCIKWSYGRMSRQKYYARRSDNVVQTDEGAKTTFELAVEMEGYEEEYYESFDGANKYKFLVKLIRDYAYILTPSELNTFMLLERGLNQDEIAEELEVTRQAVSACCIDMFAKIKAYLGAGALEDDGFTDVSKGKESIEAFFSETSVSPMPEEDKFYLREFLNKNYKVYDIHEVADMFLNGKYEWKRLLAIINKLELYNCVRRVTNPKYVFSKSETKKTLQFFKEGKTAEEISELLNIPVASLWAKRGSFTKSGELPKCEPSHSGRVYILTNEERECALQMFLELKTCDEVAEELSIPVKSVRPLRGAFVKKGLIKMTPESAIKKRAKMEST